MFQNFLVSKIVKYKRGGVYHGIPSIKFCLTVPKSFVGQPFCVSENFRWRKGIWIRGEGEIITILRQKCFVSQKK